MSDEDFEKIALMLKAAYPDANIFPDKYVMRLWFKMLGDLDYALVENAVIEHISMCPFAPKIADLRGRCATRQAEIPDWGDAWGRVQMAIRRYGMHRDDEALESLDELTREATRRMGFITLCQSDLRNMETDRAQFRDIYNELASRRKENIRLPIAAIEVREQLKQQYIGEPWEPPKLIGAVAAKDEVPQNQSSPEHVEEVLKKFRDSLCEENVDK